MTTIFILLAFLGGFLLGALMAGGKVADLEREIALRKQFDKLREGTR